MRTFFCSVVLLFSACSDTTSKQESGGRGQLGQAVTSSGTPAATISGKYYKLDVMGMSGHGQLSAPSGTVQMIGGQPSINDSGCVAFVGKTATARNIFLCDDNTSLTPNIDPHISLGSSAQINNLGHVAAVQDDNYNHTGRSVRVWTGPDTSTLVLSEATYAATLISEFVPLNDNDQVVVSAMASQEGPINLTQSNGYHTTDATGGSLPSLARDGSVVFNFVDGTRSATRPEDTNRKLVLKSYDFSSTQVITDKTCFSSLGSSAVSKDGRIIVFYGREVDGTCNGEPILPPKEPNTIWGVFAALNVGTAVAPSWKIVRLSGVKVEKPYAGGNLDGTCDSGESCQSGELGYNRVGVPFYFGSYSQSSPIGLAHQELGAPGVADDSFVVSFSATPNTGHDRKLFSNQSGIWTLRVDVSLVGTTPHVKLSTPMPVVQVGDSIGHEADGSLRVVSSLGAGNIANAPTGDDGAPRSPKRGDHRLVFYARTSSGRDLVVRGEHLDSDEDGLYDHWETGGIDFNQDGTLDLDLPALYKTDPFQRDVISEVDYMVNNDAPPAPPAYSLAGHTHNPGLQALSELENTFALHHITLHHSFDKTHPGSPTDAIDEVATGGRVIGMYPKLAPRVDIPLPRNLKYLSDFKYGDPASPCTTSWLGSAAERASPNCENILHARDISTHYVLFAHRNAQSVNAVGLAVMGGADAMICNFEFDDQDDRAVAIYRQNILIAKGDMSSCVEDAADPFAGESCGAKGYRLDTYMHELGHMLGLRHGGGDDLGCKPNYASVMNYIYGFRQIEPTRALNYSEQVLPTLDENNIDESLDFSSFPWANIHWFYNSIHYFNPVVHPVTLVNWNDNLIANESPYAAKISAYPEAGCPAGPNAVLTGYDDWSNIHLDFRQHADDGYAMGELLEPNFSNADFVTSAGQLNYDGDRWNDDVDNCITVRNDNQEDLNGNGIGDACEQFRQPTDLAVRILTSSSSTPVGANLTYTLHVSNLSSTPEGNATLVQRLPDNGVFVSASPARGSCTHSGVSVACNLGSLPDHSSMDVSVVVKVQGLGTATSSVKVHGFVVDDLDESNNTDSVSTNVLP